jgi:hypothetical protein
MVDRLACAGGPIYDGEPRAVVEGHGALERVHLGGLTEVRHGGAAVSTRPTFPVKDGNNVTEGVFQNLT